MFFLPHYLEIIASLEERLVSQQHGHRWMLFSGSPSLIAPRQTLHSAPQKSLWRPELESAPLTVGTKRNFRRLIAAVVRRDYFFTPSAPPPVPPPFSIHQYHTDKRAHFPLCIISQTCRMSEPLHSQHAGKLPRAEGHLSPKPTAS